jgi:hypothetical protein
MVFRPPNGAFRPKSVRPFGDGILDPHSIPCAPDQLFCQSATFRRHASECFLMVADLASRINIPPKQSTSQKIMWSPSEDDESIAPAVELAPTAGGRPKNKAKTTSPPLPRSDEDDDSIAGVVVLEPTAGGKPKAKIKRQTFPACRKGMAFRSSKSPTAEIS